MGRLIVAQVVAPALFLAGSLSLLVALTRPGLLAGEQPPEIRLLLTVGFLAGVAAVGFTLRRRLGRVHCGGLAAGMVALAAVFWWQLPEDAGIGMRLPLAILGAACLALGATALLLAGPEAGRPSRPRRAWALALATVLLAGAVLGADVAAAASWSAGHNIDAEPADAPPETSTPALTGAVTWSAQATGHPDASPSDERFRWWRRWLPTVGGVLVADVDGVTMRDAASGEPRWSYHRYDLARLHHMVASGDERRVAVTFAVDRDAAVTRTVVLDALTGEPLTDAGESGRRQPPFALVGDLLLYSPRHDDRPTGDIVAVTVDGERRWRRSLGNGDTFCPVGYVDGPIVTTRGGILLACSSGVYLLDRASGEVRWEHAMRGVVIPRVLSPHGDDGVTVVAAWDGRPGSTTVTALRNRDGAQLWRSELPWPPENRPSGGYMMTARWAGDTVVLAASTMQYADPAWLAGLDPRTGAIRWRGELPLADAMWSAEPAVAGLPDGRFVVIHQDADGTRMTSLDGRTGELVDSTPLPQSLSTERGPLAIRRVLRTPTGLALATFDAVYGLA